MHEATPCEKSEKKNEKGNSKIVLLYIPIWIITYCFYL